MPQLIVETTLDRIIKHFSAVGYPVGIISAFRPRYAFAENIKRTLELENKVKSSQWSYTKIDGAWRDRETGEETSERSFLIVGDSRRAENKEQLPLPLFAPAHARHQENETAKRFTDTQEDRSLLRFLHKLSRSFEQDGFTFKPSNGQVVVLSADLEIIAGPFSQITSNEMEDGYSRLRGLGGVFAFEDAPLENWIGRMVRLLAENRGLM
jgi:hypothetical protein